MKIPSPPGPKKLHPLRSFGDYRRNPPLFLQEVLRQYGDLVSLRMAYKRVILVTHPKDIEYILIRNHQNYIKGRTTKALRPLIGNGLVTSEGEFWKKQSKLVRPSFAPKNLRLLMPVIEKVTREYIEGLKQRLRQAQVSGLVIDIHQEMHHLTMNIIVRLLFAYELDGKDQLADELYEDFNFFLRFIVGRTRSPLNLPLWVPTSSHRRFHSIVKKINGLITRQVQAIRGNDEGRNGREDLNLLSLLLKTNELSKEHKMDDLMLRDELVTLLMAGHETLTNSLSWTWILLLQKQNQGYLDKIKDEIMDGNELHSPLLQGTIDEALRLYPPVWIFTREALQDDTLRGYRIPAKSLVILAPFYTHRDPRYWEGPEEFRPERFVEGDRHYSRHPLSTQGQYYPFGLGPRMCLGAQLSAIEAQIILKEFLRHFQLTPVDIGPIEYFPGITLSPTNNRLFRIEER